jgi:LysR family transcriptional regulator, benzoate and cis,cis-muconate-responsive activator of ben and cat genes
VVLAEADRAREEIRAASAGSREQVSLRVFTMAELVLDGPLRDAALGIPGIQVSATSSPGGRRGRGRAAGTGGRRGRVEPTGDQRDLAGVVLGSVVFGVPLQQGHRWRASPHRCPSAR